MGIFDWWIDKTVKDTVKKTFAEKLPAMIDAEIERQCKERGIKLVQQPSRDSVHKEEV